MVHIYAFGSICRGEIDLGSDVDLLAIVNENVNQLDLNIFSVYSYKRIQELWREGNPFAWHLSLESKLIFSDNKTDFLRKMSCPAPYKQGRNDCLKFKSIFNKAVDSINFSPDSYIFDLSTIFLAIRNFATCFSLSQLERPNFSRHSPKSIGNWSLRINDIAYDIFMRARILCTRGIGNLISTDELYFALSQILEIGNWMERLIQKIGQKNE